VPDDQLDVKMEDEDLLEEVELTSDLIVAATHADAPLTRDQVDRLLGTPESRSGDQAKLPREVQPESASSLRLSSYSSRRSRCEHRSHLKFHERPSSPTGVSVARTWHRHP
jgi:hypothetical protein